MATFDVRPGIGIGPISLGMTRDEAKAAVHAQGLRYEDQWRDDGWAGDPDLYVEAQLLAYFDADGRVMEAEVALPVERSEIGVECLGLDFGRPYAEVVRTIEGLGHPGMAGPRAGETAFDDLGMVLCGPVPVGRDVAARVDTILVRRPTFR